MARLPTYFLSHGGGPWPWMPEMRREMTALEASLAAIPAALGETPQAVLMVSGHWLDARFAVMASAAPPMLYDYGGFPPHTYTIRYEAPGAPALAQRVADLIGAAGLPTRLDASRGFDHGAFVPMAVMYPAANVPMVQLALQHRLDPAQHLALGRALAPLRDEGVLIVGSGLSYHNLRAFGPVAAGPSQAFDRWLFETLTQNDVAARSQALLDWEAAPSARFAHPHEDHLLPLMVAVGVAENEAATRIYHDRVFGGVEVSSYRFG